MDWNSIYEAIKPYLGTGAIALAILTVFSLAIRFKSEIKNIRNVFASTENEALKAFKKSLPKELFINIQSLAQSEFAKIVQELKQVVDERFLSQIKANTEITQAIASAIITMKSIPDSSKKEIARLLDLKDVDTTEALKVDLLSVPEENTVTVSQEKILVD